MPISKTWLEDGIKNFTNDKIMGAYGFVWALPDGSIWEKLIFNKYLCKIRNIFKKQIIIDRAGMGVLGFTNAIIKKIYGNKEILMKNMDLAEKTGNGRIIGLIRDTKRREILNFQLTILMDLIMGN